MKIAAIRVELKNLALTKPYTIARHTITDVENVVVKIELDNGIVGTGTASPAEEVVGETCAQTFEHCSSDFFQDFRGRDIRHFRLMIAETKATFPHFPGVQAAFDIALHDAFGQYLDIPVVAFYGQKITALPTSVTIGIMPVYETLAEAEAFAALGFRVFKVKTGTDREEDVARILQLRERFGGQFTLRVDANQGYSLDDLNYFIQKTQKAGIELIEQPLLVGQDEQLLELDESVRKILVADEVLKTPADALRLAHTPRPYGIYNIKLMKCGGIIGALDIASIAQTADIELFWGCNDESIVSITAALHAAFACENTRYIDLDGSFDLAIDVVKGGFILENGWMRPNGKPGLGVSEK